MKKKTREPIANRIAEFRRRNRLSPEQVATLLGHKSTDRLVQYERGTKAPTLKSVLKLAHIFNLPIRVMLDGYYNACRSEIKKEEIRLAAVSRGLNTVTLKKQVIDFCTYEANLEGERPSQKDVTKARRHTADLIRSAAEKLGHR